MTFRMTLLGGAVLLTAACASVDPNADYPTVKPFAETEAVGSSGDAADDPAIWVHPSDKTKSLVLGTDKQAGLYVYDLSGSVLQFIPSGRLNNVDLRQGVSFFPEQSIDIAAATNRTIDGVTLFSISADDGVEEIGDFPVASVEPYGLCTGYDESGFRVFVTYKTGAIEIYEVLPGKDGMEGELMNTIKLDSQLEGCSYDEVQNVLFVGEEEFGLWRLDLDGNEEFVRTLVDQVGSTTGLVSDVEGVDIWRGPADTGYVVASAQGGDRYVIYERSTPNRWVGTFTVSGIEDTPLDGVSHTDGLTVSSAALGNSLSRGLLVVQDDANGDNGETQNFKFVSWAEIERVFGAGGQ